MKKLSFSANEGFLSRDEMKKIIAGTDENDNDGEGCSLKVCSSNDDCAWDCRCTQGGTSKFCQSPS